MPYKDKDKQKQADRARQRRYRSNAKGVTMQGVTREGVTREGVTLHATLPTNLELCRYCGEPLPALAKPQRNPGACYDCAMKQPRKPSIEALGDTVYAGAERPVGDIA